MINWDIEGKAVIVASHPRQGQYVITKRSRGWSAKYIHDKRTTPVVSAATLADCIHQCETHANASSAHPSLGANIVEMITSLREAIKKAREENGITQAEAAAKINVGVQYWSGVEVGGRSARLEQLIKMAEAVGLEVTMTIKKGK